uniref:hypothetical protein n=1 Tax=Brachybacterium sp. GPGPB12 TaxID=3023517 RepID=UPI00404AE25D
MNRGRRTAGFLGALLAGAGTPHMLRPEPFDTIVPPAAAGTRTRLHLCLGRRRARRRGSPGRAPDPAPGRSRGGGAVRRGVPRERADGVRLAPRPAAPSGDRVRAAPAQGVLIAQALHIARNAE